MAEDERAWVRQHPEPQVTRSEDRLVLWNYPVGKADLLPPHEAALRQFTFLDSLGPEASTAEFSVRGHASRTGEGLFDNLALSRQRAEGVGKILRRIGFRFVNVSAAGTAEPADAADAGQSFARNRRVEVTKFIPPVKVKPLPRAPGAAPPSTPPAQRPSSGSGIGAIIPELKLKLITFEGQIAGYVDFEATIEATFKGKVRGPNGDLAFDSQFGRWSDEALCEDGVSG